MRRVLSAVALLATMLFFPSPSGSSTDVCEGVAPTDPSNLNRRVEQRPAGTIEEYCLFYGPYTIPPGHDLSRLDIDVSLARGFILGGGPSVVQADGTELSHQQMHIHHAHWWFLDPEAENYGPVVPGWKWIAGSGEEETEGDFQLVADSDPSGPGYGIYVRDGERVLQVNMLHNKTTQNFVLWVKIRIKFIFGNPSEILTATGREYRDLTPVLTGGSFDVPRGGGTDGIYRYPRDASGNQSCGGGAGQSQDCVVPGLGRVWTAPFSGTIVIGAGHLHPGGRQVIVTNIGKQDDACPNTRTDGISGTTLFELDTIDRTVPNSEDFQIEITQPGFRAKVREGDRLVLNGSYATADHGWWDAMTFAGFYIDQHAVSDAEKCQVYLAGKPVGWVPPLMSSYPDMPVWEGVPNRNWSGTPDPVCGPGFGPPCDSNLAPKPSGVATARITIAGFRFLPGDLGFPAGSLGPPVITRGTPINIYNADIGAYIRHTITSCSLPCDGPYVSNYPLPDGKFDTGYLGYEPTTGGGLPFYTLQTNNLTPGRYAYFCRTHAWMRGAFDVI